MFVKMEKGRYINFNNVLTIYIDGNYEIYVRVLEGESADYLWKSGFSTHEEAQNWLEHEMMKYHGIA